MDKWLRKGLLVLQPIVTLCAVLYRLNGGVYLIISTLVIPKVTED